MKPVVLIILDGWGIAPDGTGNAIFQAQANTFQQLWASYPHTQLSASGEAVGLPKGEPGNTETGHLNLGAGRIVYQDLPRINMAIADGSFFGNSAFLGSIEHARKNSGKLHLLGLIGAGGVHANIEHLFALLRLCKQQQFDRVYLHCITDGRDSPPCSALTYLQQLQQEIQRVGIGTIATVMGRYYAMDRDGRWDRTEAAYRALTEGVGQRAETAEQAVQQSYQQQKTDEFIAPTVMVRDGSPVALVDDNDAVIFSNYRIDRPRQLTKAFVLPDLATAVAYTGFDPYAIRYHKKHTAAAADVRRPFQRKRTLHNLQFVTMTQYEKQLPVVIAYPVQTVSMPIGKVVADDGKRQLHMAETEKERFVTYYFNGQRESTFYAEDHLIVPSPTVATYDLKPEMSANELTDTLLSRINARLYDFIVVNFANADMVGHTGMIPAAIAAVQTLDDCLTRVTQAVLSIDGACVITADHGNVEQMLDLATHLPSTEHTTSPVPFVVVAQKLREYPTQLQSGILADVAPTILYLMELTPPEIMSGRNLLQHVRI